MQSEYWSIVYYSLLITISSFLITSIWQDRTSALKRGDEVTVEPDDKSFNDNVQAVEGSYFAVVEEDSEEVGSAVMYRVRTVDGDSMNVRREHLRHRQWYRIAFLEVTNDKKHDCWSSQAFACRRLAFYVVFHKQGLDEALKFALHDAAETAREKAAELAENAGSTAAAAGSVANGASIQGQAAEGVLAAVREARAPVAHQERRRRCDVSEEEFERRQALVKQESGVAATHRQRHTFQVERESQLLV
jgi:hypothetical protein